MQVLIEARTTEYLSNNPVALEPSPQKQELDTFDRSDWNALLGCTLPRTPACTASGVTTGDVLCSPQYARNRFVESSRTKASRISGYVFEPEVRQITLLITCPHVLEVSSNDPQHIITQD